MKSSVHEDKSTGREIISYIDSQSFQTESRYGRSDVYIAWPVGHWYDAQRTVIVPGFSESEVQYRPVAEELANNYGMVGFTYGNPDGLLADAVRYKDDPLRRQQEVLNWVVTDFATKEHPATFVAHSMGAEAALRFAQEHPDRVESLILLAPAGLIQGQGLNSLLKSVIKDASAKDNPERNTDHYEARLGEPVDAKTLAFAGLQGLVDVIRRPARSLIEAKAADQLVLAKSIKAVDQSLPIHIVMSHNDNFFDYETALKQAEDVFISNPNVSISSVADRMAKHGQWPQPGRVAEIIYQLTHNHSSDRIS